MRPAVIDLAQFYASRLGKVASRVIRRRVRHNWPDLGGLRVLGIGYATPYLALFREETERTMAVMPASQGVNHWPRSGANLVALTEEIDLPFADSSIDRVLLVHGLETADQAEPLLEEIWRILTPPGRLMVVAPHRRGLWARFEYTPFGHGKPYSQPQIMRLLREMDFLPYVVETALYVPPSSWRMVLRVNRLLENLGRRWGLGFPGVLVVEAGKQIYAATPERLPTGRRSKRRAAQALPGGVSTRNK
jgi:SAM-dependent methyltransferase